MADLISQYGYWALAIGCFLEGETILLIAAFAAHRGYLDITAVAFVAGLSTFLGDQLYFLLGRHFGNRLLAWRPALAARKDRVLTLLHRYHAGFILSFRFLYGLRTVSPFILGMSEVRAARFLWLNAVAAAVWAIAFSALGYSFGHVAELLLDRVKKYELDIILGLLAVGAALWALRHLRQRRQR